MGQESEEWNGVWVVRRWHDGEGWLSDLLVVVFLSTKVAFHLLGIARCGLHEGNIREVKNIFSSIYSIFTG
jgi:hypothetical protein